MNDRSFPSSRRLLTAGEYRRVFSDTQFRVSQRELLLLASRNDRGTSRLGLIFAKKHAKLAVQRNLFKRITRETFRQLPDLPDIDVIVLGRQGITLLDQRLYRQRLDAGFRRLLRDIRSSICAEAT